MKPTLNVARNAAIIPVELQCRVLPIWNSKGIRRRERVAEKILPIKMASSNLALQITREK
jgi:hypothetical protein